MDTPSIIILCVIGVALLGFIVYKAVVFTRMSKEDKTKTIKTYVSGLVALAEEEIGKGHGDEKLEFVEKYFSEKAPFAYKILLTMLGSENLKGIIEDALAEIKKSFGKED